MEAEALFKKEEHLALLPGIGCGGGGHRNQPEEAGSAAEFSLRFSDSYTEWKVTFLFPHSLALFLFFLLSFLSLFGKQKIHS